MRKKEASRKRLLSIPLKPPTGVKTILASMAGAIRNGLWIGIISTAATAPLIAEYFHRLQADLAPPAVDVGQQPTRALGKLGH